MVEVGRVPRLPSVGGNGFFDTMHQDLGRENTIGTGFVSCRGGAGTARLTASHVEATGFRHYAAHSTRVHPWGVCAY